MPTVTLQRSTEIEFQFTDRSGHERSVTIPAVSIGQYRRALQLEAEVPEHETPAEAQARLMEQARILCGPDHAAFLDELDPEMLIEVMQVLLSVYAGLPPAAVLDIQRALKKKTLLQAMAGIESPVPDSASASATG